MSGEVPAAILDNGEKTLAFLDIHPLSSGHTLVIPKREVPTILELERDELADLFLTVQRVSAILSKALNPAGFTIGINHGEAAGQAVEHLHVHVIPRYAGDEGLNIHSILKKPPHLSFEEVKKILNI